MIYEDNDDDDDDDDDDNDDNYDDDSSRSDGRRLPSEARFIILLEFASRVTPTRIAKQRVILLWPRIALSTGLGVRFAQQT